jgi:hypothetical protein
MATVVGKFLALSPERRTLVLAAAALQLAARFAIAAAGLPFAVNAAGRLATLFAPPHVALDTLAWALAASALRVRGTCLTQAIAALALRGRPTTPDAFVLGVRRSGRPGSIPEFHAWMEIEGVALPCTPGGESYVPMVVWGR